MILPAFKAALLALAVALPGTPAATLNPSPFAVSHEPCPLDYAYACVVYDSLAKDRITVFIPSDAPETVWVHELAHVVDYRYLTAARRARILPLLYRTDVARDPTFRAFQNRVRQEDGFMDGWNVMNQIPGDPPPAERFADFVSRCAGVAQSYRYRKGRLLPKSTDLRCGLVAANIRGARAHG